MAKEKLFEYAVLYHPKSKKDSGGNDITEKSVVVTDVTRVLANSEKQVGMLAARGIPAQYEDKLEEIEIAVRPF